MKKILTAALFLLLLSAIWAVEEISLSEAVEMATAKNPELKSAKSEMLSAEKTMQSSYLGLGPSGSLSYNKVYQNPGSDTGFGILDESSSIGISATQPIFNGGKIFLSAQIARNSYKIAEASYRSKLLEIMAETESQYYTVQSNKELVKALEKSLEQSEINLSTAKARQEAGLLSKAEYLQMESEKLSTEVDLLNMRNALRLSKLSLANYIGCSSEMEVSEFELTEYENILEILQNSDTELQESLTREVVEYGMNHNPTLQMTSLGVSSAKKAKLIAGGNILPSVNLSYSYDWQNSNLAEDFDGSSSVVLSASLPIFPVADNALDYKAASYDLRSSEYTQESTENGIELAIRSSCLNLFTSAKSVESARVSNDYAWESWKQLRENFEQGLISSSDLLSAEVMVISSDNSYITARQNFLTSLTGLAQLLGMPEKAELIKIIENMEE